MIKILFTALCPDQNIHYFNENSINAVFIWNGIGILKKDLNYINFGNTNYDEEDHCYQNFGLAY